MTGIVKGPWSGSHPLSISPRTSSPLVALRRRRPRPRHRPGRRRRRRPHARLHGRRGPAPDARDRAVLVLEPQPGRVLVQGGDLGRPPVGAGRPLRLRRRRPAGGRGPGRATAPATPGPGPASTGPSAPTTPGAVGRDDRRPRGERHRRRRRTAPGATSSASCAATHRIVPVWRELVADTLTPVSAFLLVVGERPGLPARVGGGRRALGAVLLRGPRPAGHARGPRAER